MSWKSNPSELPQGGRAIHPTKLRQHGVSDGESGSALPIPCGPGQAERKYIRDFLVSRGIVTVEDSHLACVSTHAKRVRSDDSRG